MPRIKQRRISERQEFVGNTKMKKLRASVTPVDAPMKMTMDGWWMVFKAVEWAGVLLRYYLKSWFSLYLFLGQFPSQLFQTSPRFPSRSFSIMLRYLYHPYRPLSEMICLVAYHLDPLASFELYASEQCYDIQ